MGRAARIGLLFAFGAVWLSLCDGFHTHSGTTEYRQELVLRAAWWVPLLFASASGFGGLTYAMAHQRVAPSHPVPPWHHVALGLVVYTACYAATAWVRVPAGAMLGALALLAAAGWWVLDRSPIGVALAVVTGFTGSATEATLIAGGHFRYLHPDVAGVPVWLFGLYLLSSVVIGALARLLLARPAPGGPARP